MGDDFQLVFAPADVKLLRLNANVAVILFKTCLLQNLEVKEGEVKLVDVATKSVTEKQIVNPESEIKQECVHLKSLDTSLSSWLVESHKLTKKVDDPSESEKNYENRQMLEEIIPLKLKQLNDDSSSALSTLGCAGDSQVLGQWVVIGRGELLIDRCDAESRDGQVFVFRFRRHS